MSRNLIRARWACLAAVFAPLLCSCQSLCLTGPGDVQGECEDNAYSGHPRSMHQLAAELDHLESCIDSFGSVVVKHPDVWGQARLSKYRDEFEKEMLKDFPKFAESLQGSVTRSDQNYLANALAISSVAAAKQTKSGGSGSTGASSSSSSTTAAAPSAGGGSTDGQPNTDVFKGFDSITRTATRSPLNIGFSGISTGGLSLEPTVVLDQKARYLNYLDQIRRNNEGDDTTDSPGYSLNLVRMPVSLLPGKHTQTGYGAEITFTMTPYVSDDLLASTFYTLVVNDLVDLLYLPAAKYSDEIFAEMSRDTSKTRDDRLNKALTNTKSRYISGPSDPNLPPGPNGQSQSKARGFSSARSGGFSSAAARQRSALLPIPPSQLDGVMGFDNLVEICESISTNISYHHAAQNHAYVLDVRSVLQQEIEAAYDMMWYSQDGPNSGNRDLWEFCTTIFPQYNQNLLQIIQNGDESRLKTVRDCFLAQFASKINPSKNKILPALAWAIVVESTLLNDMLQYDIDRESKAQGNSLKVPKDPRFHLPIPSPEDRNVFRDYVLMRWPIHVFTLDPTAQDQNIADAYSRRQEMQLALSLAFSSGSISARNMTRYARRLEEDMETITLNRTQLGFSHGDNVFGWRFYPRFQTPGFESNATSLVRDQLIGGPSKNEETRQTRLEPGMRECVALVMMPSFVPYVTCESSSNWFKLTNPKHKEFDLKEAVRLGSVVKDFQIGSPSVKNADRYRDGDFASLQAKAKQLEARLPLQKLLVQVPYENTLGGYEMFNTGITALAPLLRGWFGGPGAASGADTQLFLVGDHFSVRQTQVVAGGKPVEFELLSRQVMKVTIPKGTMANERDGDQPDAGNPGAAAKPLPIAPCLPWSGGGLCDAPPTKKTFKYIDVHVATPYGVTAHLEVPVVEAGDPNAPAEKNTGLSWNQGSVEIPFVYAAGGISVANPPMARPALSIKWDAKKLSPLAAVASYDLKFAFAKPFGEAKVTYPNPFDDKVAQVLAGIPATNLIDLVVASTQPVPSTTKLLLVPNDMMVQVIAARFAGYFGPKNINPPVPVRLNKAVLVAKDALGTVLSQTELGNELTITWQDVGACLPNHFPLGCVQPVFPNALPCQHSDAVPRVQVNSQHGVKEGRLPVDAESLVAPLPAVPPRIKVEEIIRLPTPEKQ